MLQYEKVIPLMGRLHLYILIGLVLLVTKLCISNTNDLWMNCKQVVVLYKDELKELDMSKGNLALSPFNTPKVDPTFLLYFKNRQTILTSNYAPHNSKFI
jgi:hypothetical protein